MRINPQPIETVSLILKHHKLFYEITVFSEKD